MAHQNVFEDCFVHLNIFIFKDFDKVILHRLKECLRIFSCYILSLYDDICCIIIALREHFLIPTGIVRAD